MKSVSLKRKLKTYEGIPEELGIRLHRSISWLQCAEQQEKDPDIMFITQWIAFNACYAMDMNSQSTKTEREKFKGFIGNLVRLDHEKRIFNILWQKFSGPVKILIENEYVFRGFWDFQRGDTHEWRKAFDKSNEDALRYMSANNVGGVLEILLDRLYILRNQLMHGGATIEFLNSIHKKNGWKFNWKKEEKEINRFIYKLVLESNKSILLGLISLETREDHVHIHLVERIPNEFGMSKKYEGIGGNLFAFACKYSHEIGFDGVVAFSAKTNLIHHYSVTLGATLIKNQKMFIHSKQANFLINKYFKDEEK